MSDSIKTATVVKIFPTRIWIESGMMGERVVVVQHESCEPFDYATFGYDYRYTSNSGTLEAANRLALQLGATEPVEMRQRYLHIPTAEELLNEIECMQEILADIQDGETEAKNE